MWRENVIINSQNNVPYTTSTMREKTRRRDLRRIVRQICEGYMNTVFQIPFHTSTNRQQQTDESSENKIQHEPFKFVTFRWGHTAV